MNRLSVEKQVLVLNALVEGNSIRSVERMVGVHRDTIMRLLCRTGEACERIMDEKMRGLSCDRLQVDEIWTFVRKKRGRMTETERKTRLQWGDIFIFVAMDPDTKLVPAYRVGKRTPLNATRFMCDLANRLASRPQITTDAYGGYIAAIEQAFASDVDWARLLKTFTTSPAGDGRYAPPAICHVEPENMVGRPDPDHISTSLVERQNLTIRMQMRRLTRLTNGFSKKLDNLKAAVALHFVFYDFCRVHLSLRVTPAMEAGITDRLWRMSDILAWTG